MLMLYKFFKRVFDIIFSLAGLLLLSPIIIIISIIIKLTSEGPIIYKQERAGRNWKTFNIFKFRTMIISADKIGPLLSVNNDSRVTSAGKFLRKYKLDEIPQLLNVLKGDMSIVGPRPEVLKYTNDYRHEYEEILKEKPGITDLASIVFLNENKIFLKDKNIESIYIGDVLPIKLQLQILYTRKKSILYDLKIILWTIYLIIFSKEDKPLWVANFLSIPD